MVAQEFWFANGVALSKDEDFIAVVETNTQTVHRVWLTGAKVPHRVDQHLVGFVSCDVSDVTLSSMQSHSLKC